MQRTRKRKFLPSLDSNKISPILTDTNSIGEIKRMKSGLKTRYSLCDGIQVREEDFGLLFYSMYGPKLFFLSSGNLLNVVFFKGEQSLVQWMNEHSESHLPDNRKLDSLMKKLTQLVEKGIINEC